MKLQLINSPLPSNTIGCLRSSCYPPLNLISLGTYINSMIKDIEIEILDGEIIGLEGIFHSLSADLYGISSNSISYESAVTIGEYIKQKDPNARIVLGGAHATHFTQLIMLRRKCFDDIVIGQGETALLEIIKDEFSSQRQINTKKDLETQTPKEHRGKRLYLEELHPLDFTLIDLVPYHTNFRRHYPQKGRYIGLPIYSSTGCDWRYSTGGCVYCSIPTYVPSRVSTNKFWSEILRLQNDYSADFVWDISDTFTSNRKWLKDIAATKPAEANVGFHVYARIDNIDADSVRLLKTIGVQEVLIGIESFDQRMLHSAKKGITRQRIDTALSLLNEGGIQVAVSFVLGLPKENEDTLKATLDHLAEISWMKNIIENHASVLIPLPGSQLFTSILADEEMGTKYYNSDILDLMNLQIDYLNKFTHCGADVVFDYYTRIDSHFKSAGPFYLSRSNPFLIS